MPTIFTNTKIAVCVPTRPVPNAKKMDILSQFSRPATYPVSAIVIDPCQRSGFILSRRKFDVGIFRKSSFRAVKSRNLFVGTQAAATVEAPVLVMMRIFDGGSSRARMAQTQTQTCVDSWKMKHFSRRNCKFEGANSNSNMRRFMQGNYRKISYQSKGWRNEFEIFGEQMDGTVLWANNTGRYHITRSRSRPTLSYPHTHLYHTPTNNRSKSTLTTLVYFLVSDCVLQTSKRIGGDDFQ